MGFQPGFAPASFRAMRNPALALGLAAALVGCTAVDRDGVDRDGVGVTRAAGLVSPDIVIAEVFAGGGNAGAPFKKDYAVLFNRGNTTVALGGTKLWYASDTGTFNSSMVLPTASLAPGQAYLVAFGGGTNGVDLPTPDASSSSFNLSAGGGKVTLTLAGSSLATCGTAGTPCDAATFIDFVGWGTAAQAEGTKAVALTNTTSLSRGMVGCTDTGDNSMDFASGVAVTPRTSGTAATPCAPPPDLTGADLTVIMDLTPPPDMSGSFVLLNEVKWNPQGSDTGQEFVELIGAGSIAPFTYLLSVDGDGTAVGRINFMRDVSGLALGANGLLLVKPAGTTIPGVAAATTMVNDTALNASPLQNGTETVLLVRFASAQTITVGSNLSSLAPYTVVDGIAAKDGASGTVYSGGAAFAACPTAGASAVDAAYRKVGDVRASELLAWTAGQAIGNPSDQFLDDVAGCTTGGPATASLSPGRANDDPLLAPPDLGTPADMKQAVDMAKPPTDMAQTLSTDMAQGTVPDLSVSTAPIDMAKASMRDEGCTMAPGATRSTPLAFLLLVVGFVVLARRRVR